jgi:hypothetical protein
MIVIHLTNLFYMQAIKNTWNNYRARRRLEGLWITL